MEFASYLAGDKWSDHPPCTHALLAALARDVNDMTTDAARAELLPHVHRVVGLIGDDPLVAPSLAVLAATAAMPVASLERQRALAAGLINIGMHVDSLQPQVTAALALCPDADRWARRYFDTTRDIRREFTRRAAESMIHTAVVGIAFACYAPGESHADARLVALLIAAIDLVEQLARVDGARDSSRAEPRREYLPACT